ncbi:helix-turn-helix domain-containing protein [Sphingomonas solaris]
MVRWRIIDLAQMLWDDFSLSVSRPTLNRELRALGNRKLSARPRHHAQEFDAIEALKRGLCRRVGQGPNVPPARHTDRDQVPGRGSDRAEEQLRGDGRSEGRAPRHRMIRCLVPAIDGATTTSEWKEAL